MSSRTLSTRTVPSAASDRRGAVDGGDTSMRRSATRGRSTTPNRSRWASMYDTAPTFGRPWAKYADSVLRISLVRFSSRSSRSRGREPLALPRRHAQGLTVSLSAWRPHFRSDAAVGPASSLLPAARCAGRCSVTSRMARARTSGENPLGRPIDPIRPRNEVSGKVGALQR